MLTAKRAFGGEDITDTLARIIEREPDLAQLPSTTPSSILRLLHRCLEKDRNRRLPDVGVARIEIDAALATPRRGESAGTPPVQSRRRERLLWAAALATTAIVATTAGLYLRPGSVDAPEVRLQINTPPGNPAHFALSPDGRSVVFQATTDAQTRLWLRPLGNGSLSTPRSATRRRRRSRSSSTGTAPDDPSKLDSRADCRRASSVSCREPDRKPASRWRAIPTSINSRLRARSMSVSLWRRWRPRMSCPL